MAGLILLALLVALIWAEIRVFALVGAETGALVVVLGTFATAALGLKLFRSAGAAAMARLREAVASGRPPVLEMADGGAIAIAAGLLLLPGFVTDAAGFALFVPGLRTVAALALLRLAFSLLPKGRVFMAGGFQRPGPGRGGGPSGGGSVPGPENPAGMTIEGDFERKD